MSKSYKGGIILIIAGLILLLNQLGVIPGQLFLFMLALGFIAAYVLLGARNEYGNVGFLIPGTVLLSIAIFASLSGHPGYAGLSPAYFFLGLSFSFFAVFFVHTYWFKDKDHGDRFWPVYPAGGLLILTGIISISISGYGLQYIGLLNYLWIVALIAAGVWMVVKSIKKQ